MRTIAKLPIVDSLGVWFFYKEWDEIGWIWPWRRDLSGGMPWFSISFDLAFRSLKDVRRMWEEYFQAAAQDYSGPEGPKAGRVD